MNFEFDKANAESRAQTIRQASAEQQKAAQFTSANEPVKTTVIVPQFRRSFAMSVMITVIGIFALFVVTTPAGAQGFEPKNEGDAYGEAFYIFTMGNVAYVQENYEESVELFEESISMIPVEIFEQLPDYAHMYYYLGRSQMENGQEEEALESFILYVEYAQGEALPEIIEYVESQQ